MASREVLSVNLGLSVQPETDDPKLFGELTRVYNAIKILASAVDQYTGAITPSEDSWQGLLPSQSVRTQGILRLYIMAAEDIASFTMVNLFGDSGQLKARLAVADPGTPLPAKAYCSAGDVLAGEIGEFTLYNSLHPGFTGLVPGDEYYLSSTPGLIGTKPTITGEYSQFLGFALSETDLFFCPLGNGELIP